MLRLDLATLTWRRMTVRNQPSSLPDTPAACLAGGVTARLLRGMRAAFHGLLGDDPFPKSMAAVALDAASKGVVTSSSHKHLTRSNSGRSLLTPLAAQRTPVAPAMRAPPAS